MASNSNRKSASSGRSKPRKRVVIGAEETVRVRYRHDKPEVESERRATRSGTRPKESAARANGGSTPGKRLSKAKQQERARRQRIVRIRRNALAVAALTLLVLVVWLIVALYRAPIFVIDSVNVSGNRHLTKAEILAAARVPEGSTLLRIRRGPIEARLERDPWVSEAVLERDFPGTLRIRIKERDPSVIVDQGGDSLWVVSSDGYCLGRRSAEETAGIVVRDAPATRLRPGTKIKTSELVNAVRLVNGLESDLKSKVDWISAPSVDDTALHTHDDIEIFVGSYADVRAKSRIAMEILRREKGVVYINVRVLDRPTWRGVEQDQ